MTDNRDMVSLWQEMGSSTGSMIGRFIGLGAQMTLDMFNNNFVRPAKSVTDNNPHIRSDSWGRMGQEFGQAIGEFIGSGMDILVKTIDNTLVQPMSQAGQNAGNASEQLDETGSDPATNDCR